MFYHTGYSLPGISLPGFLAAEEPQDSSRAFSMCFAPVLEGAVLG